METDVAAMLLRVALGAIFILHGWNHGIGNGRIDGTERWFASIGLQPARLQALSSTYLEIAAGLALLLGVVTPFASAAAIGVMATAFVTVHRINGFFIFRDGYEYVLLVTVGAASLAAMGPGSWSLDHVLSLDIHGPAWSLVATGAGILGSAAMLAACWRPSAPDQAAEAP